MFERTYSFVLSCQHFLCRIHSLNIVPKNVLAVVHVCIGEQSLRSRQIIIIILKSSELYPEKNVAGSGHSNPTE